MLLVTGGAGFIGSHLVDRLLERGEDIVCVDDFNDFYAPELKRRNVKGHLQSSCYRLVEADIRDFERIKHVFERNKIDKVIHLAARAGVRQSLLQPLLYEDVNVRATIGLLELARQHGIGQFVFASSSSVYGAQTSVPFSEEDHIYRTISPYAATKYSAELMCHTYHHLYGIPVTCLRFFTAYGPRQRPEMAIHAFTRMICQNVPIPFYGDGTTARDYTYIDDIIQGVITAIDTPFGFEVLNLGESATTTLRQLVEHIERETGQKAHLNIMPSQPGDVEITYADISKARRLLNYSPTTPIEEGIRKFVAWYKASEVA